MHVDNRLALLRDERYRQDGGRCNGGKGSHRGAVYVATNTRSEIIRRQAAGGSYARDSRPRKYAKGGVEFTASRDDPAWHSREFVVKDCDGRLLAFGADQA
jgi:hypothetical protein